MQTCTWLPAPECRIHSTHVVIPQVVVVVFEAVVYDADPDPPARVPHGVDGDDVQAQVGQVRSGAGVLLEVESDEFAYRLNGYPVEVANVLFNQVFLLPCTTGGPTGGH